MLPDQIIILTVLVLLPLIPAFLLFKLLPSSAIVKGPLQGLNVALSGAFGGYVALTVFVAAFYAQTLKPDTYRTWRIQGYLQLPPGTPRESLMVNLGPSMWDIDANNKFYVDIPIKDGSQIPDLILAIPNYPTQALTFSGEETPFAKNYSPRIDKANNRISIKEPVVFEKPIAAPAYDPNAAQQPTIIAGGG